jgi:hypothetical protein
VLLLGFKGASSYAGNIASYLNDVDIAGQVLDTFLKMRVAGYSKEVMPLIESKYKWIRRKAEVYLERYSSIA